MGSKVALVRCEDYQQDRVSAAITSAVDLLGGWGQFVRAGERVLIKPNFIAPRPTTIPAQTDARLIMEIARQVGQLGAKVLIGDSTAWGSTRKNAELAGLGREELEAVGAELVKFNRSCRVSIDTPGGTAEVRLARAVLEADKIINVPKLKSHQQLVYSGAIKNCFGAVAGKRKAWWHFRYSQPTRFADMIVGVYGKVAPVLNIVDGVVAMEGQGPISGKARKMGVVLASADAAAMDVIGCELIGINAENTEIWAAAKRAGVGTTDLEEIEVVGEKIGSLKVKDFVMAEPHPIRFSLLRVIKSTAKQVRILMREKMERTREKQSGG